MFKVIIQPLSDNAEVHLIHLDELTSDIKTYLDTKIIEICEGDGFSELSEIKTQLLEFLDSKRDSTTEIGAIAEFFIHVYLNNIGFSQEFMFFNLEERSIKKGFDGFYSMGEEDWLLESKSGNSTTNQINHTKKIKDAYNDLQDKVSGKQISGRYPNDPWRNAYMHARHGNINSSATLITKIAALSTEFTKRIFHDIKEFNIIPGSTIFYNGDWEESNIDEISKILIEWLTEIEYQKIKAICVSNKTKQMFWDYLNT